MAGEVLQLLKEALLKMEAVSAAEAFSPFASHVYDGEQAIQDAVRVTYRLVLRLQTPAVSNGESQNGAGARPLPGPRALRVARPSDSPETPQGPAT